MTEADFDCLRDLLYRRSGLSLGLDKRYLAESRLGILCRRRGIADISTLVRSLRAGDETLTRLTVEAMTTNETLFFRDTLPFDLFRDVILPERIAANAGSRSLRIWCAAVSSGQEAYSIAMLLNEYAQALAGWSVEVLGTDISQEMIEKARAGLYSQFEIQRGLPIRSLMRYFTQEGDAWRVDPALRAMVEFREHNLLEPDGHLGQFDVIFCRNVLIYFDVPTKARVMASIARRLDPEGAILLGAAETVIGITTAIVPDREHRGLYRTGGSSRGMAVRTMDAVGRRPPGAAPPSPSRLRERAGA